MGIVDGVVVGKGGFHLIVKLDPDSVYRGLVARVQFREDLERLNRSIALQKVGVWDRTTGCSAN